MKIRFIHILSLLLFALLFSSCAEKSFETPGYENTGENRIILRLNGGRLGTRAQDEVSGGAESEASNATMSTDELIEATENRIEHIDVLIFKATDNIVTDTKVHYERIVTPDENPSGIISLQKTRDAFDAGDPYYIYLIANSKIETSEFESLARRSDLYTIRQMDERIHATGIIPTSSVDPNLIPPRSFLMDGLAYDPKTTAAPAAGDTPRVVLNVDNSTDDIKLNVDLRRAAAKIRITIFEGDDITFVKTPTTASYHVHNVPYSAYLVADATGKDNSGKVNVPSDALLRESRFVAGPYFEWEKRKNPDGTEMRDNKEITITAYAYSHTWADQSHDRRTSVIVSLPLYAGKPKPQLDTNGNPIQQVDADGNPVVDADGNPVYVPQRDRDDNIIREGNYVNKDGNDMWNYYRIPISKERLLRRNTLYTLSVEVNALGSSEISRPVELDALNYKTWPWEDVGLSVGDESDSPQYFNINVDTFEMHNDSLDTQTLHFSSSSPIEKVEVVEAYFYDKEGIRRNLDDEYETNTGEKKQIDIEAFNRISATYGTNDYSGPISVFSPLPTNNAIRTIVLRFTNAEGLTQDVTVLQYPLEYITHEKGWYSYRDDFYHGTDPSKFTSFEKLNGMSYTFGTPYQTAWSDWSTDKNVAGPRLDSGEGRYVSASWDNGRWTYSTSSELGFFRSKMVDWKDVTPNGHVPLYFYYYSEVQTLEGNNPIRTIHHDRDGEKRSCTGCGEYHDKWRIPPDEIIYESYRSCYTYELKKGSNVGLDNPRIYHITITSTSKSYILGVPAKIPETINGKEYLITDPSVANSKLVSPSFMLASQLGAVSSGVLSSIDMAASHCASYVEKTMDGVVYDDWRLPTRAEIEIIYNFQYKNEEDDFAAMAEVLSGDNYWCASSLLYENPSNIRDENKKDEAYELLVKNPNKTGNDHAIRCIRDVY